MLVCCKAKPVDGLGQFRMTLPPAPRWMARLAVLLQPALVIEGRAHRGGGCRNGQQRTEQERSGKECL